MALLTGDQVRRVFTDDGPRRWSLFAVLGTTTGDTIDLASLSFYRTVKQSVFMGCTVVGTVAGTQSGATVTVPAGLTADSCYLLVDGIPT
jgi:hypothetical protein